MKKRSDKNSATSAVAGFVGAINDRIPLPAGVELRSEAELIIWHQFTRARARSDWRDMDLILLAKIVKMEADIRAAQIELDAMGMMIENKRGTPIPNPLLSVIDTLERRQLAVIRSMSLNQTASDPRTINGSAKVEGEARAALRDVGVEGLIAPARSLVLCIRWLRRIHQHSRRHTWITIWGEPAWIVRNEILFGIGA